MLKLTVILEVVSLKLNELVDKLISVKDAVFHEFGIASKVKEPELGNFTDKVTEIVLVPSVTVVKRVSKVMDVLKVKL